MTWLIGLDDANMLRDGRWVHESSPAPVPGYARDAMWDGAQAVLYRAVGTTNKTMVFRAVNASDTPARISLHDVRIYGARIERLRVEASTNGSSWTTVREWSEDDLRRSDWSVSTAGAALSTAQYLRLTLVPRPGGEGAEWAIGEVCIFRDLIASADVPNAPPPARRTQMARRWTTVANGPWRTKLSEPTSEYVLSFPATNRPGQIEWLEEIWRRCDGALRPVVLVPDASQWRAIHGHLSDVLEYALGLGGVYEEGISLVVTESMRSLR